MAIIKKAELYWAQVGADKWSRYQSKPTNPAKWSIQIRTKSKEEAARWNKEFGLKVSRVEDVEPATWKASISRFAFKQTDGVEDTSNPNTPVNVIAGDGSAIDPNIIGNGSIGNISFFVKNDKSSRTLKGIQITSLVKYEDPDEFELDEFEIIDGEDGSDDSSVIDDEVIY